MSSVFERKAPDLMRKLMVDVPTWDELDAAACIGNAGHESGGLTNLQEDKPTVKGSRGGYGWFQWTGKRRTAYEAWCEHQNLNPASDEANYGFLLVELRGPEKAAVAKTHAAEGIEAKTKAFEMAFERAGVKHYPSRISYAKKALAAYTAATKPATAVAGSKPLPVPAPVAPDPAALLDLTEAEARGYQQQLQDAGYTEVGWIDGKWGTRSKAALVAMQLDNDLPATTPPGSMNTATRDFIKANGIPKRKIDPARANATEATLIAQGNLPAAAKPSIRTRITGAVGGVLAFIGTVVAAMKDYISDAVSYLQPVMSVLSDVPGWVWGLGIAGICASLYVNGKQGADKAIEAVRRGQDTGI